MAELTIADKSDSKTVQTIIAMGYPQNRDYLPQLLDWTADPNWPIAGAIYDYFRQLDEAAAALVFKTAQAVDHDWRYSLLTQIITRYPKPLLEKHTDYLRTWARQPGSEECDFTALALLVEHQLLPAEELLAISRRNLYVYNLWIKETLEASAALFNSQPFGEHTL